MGDPRRVRGQVLRAGGPVDGAYVRIMGRSGDFVSERRTGSDGAFTVYLTPGTWSLVAFAPQTQRVTREFEVGSEEETTVVVELEGD